MVQSKIILIRGRKVILDADLAELYGVATKRLNEQVKRNKARFPEDFMFQFSREEVLLLARSRSQFATLKRGCNVKYLPHAFTEHGAVMAANVLNSPHAIEASIFVVRAFVHLRELLATHKQLADKLHELEKNTTPSSELSLRPYVSLCRSRRNLSAKLASPRKKNAWRMR